MKRLALITCLAALLAACGDSTYTMYRSNAKDPKAREYFATFGSNGNEKDNQVNCDLSSTLLTMQRTSQLRYWCEKGPFKK